MFVLVRAPRAASRPWGGGGVAAPRARATAVKVGWRTREDDGVSRSRANVAARTKNTPVKKQLKTFFFLARPPPTKQQSGNVSNLVRAHERLLKLEARVDLFLRTRQVAGETSPSPPSASGAQAAAAAAEAEEEEEEDEAAAIAEEQNSRDIRWRVRDAVEDTFAAGWEARRRGGGGGAVVAVAPRPRSAAAAAVVAAAAVASPGAAAASAASSSRVIIKPPTSTTITTTTTTTTTSKGTPVAVEFVARCQHTAYGERVWVCGSGAALGGWKPKGALRLRWGQGGRWHAVAELEALEATAEGGGTSYEFKALLRRDDDGEGGSGGGGAVWARERNYSLWLGVDAGQGLRARVSEGVSATVLEDGSVRVEFDAGF